MREQRSLVHSLERITNLILEGKDLEATLDRIVSVLSDVLRVERCSVMLKTGRDWLRMRGARGIAPEVVRRAVARVGVGIAGSVAESGEGRLLSHVGEESQIEDNFVSNSAICVPLRLRKEVLGVLNVSNKRDESGSESEEFDEEDLVLTTVLANQAALAIQAARARESDREQKRLQLAMTSLEAQVDSLQQQAAALSVISQVTDSMVSTGLLDEILPSIVSSTSSLLGATRGSLMLIEPDSQTLRIRAAVGIAPEVVESARTELGRGIAGGVAERGEALLIRDIRRQAAPGEPDRSDAYRNSSALCVPLKIKGDVLGVLNINDRADDEDFTDGDLFVAQVIANQAALAIFNSRLLADSMEAAATRRALDVARAIQQSFLPACPGVKGVQVAGCSEPCDETGGDYIDYAACLDGEGRPTGELFLAVGDVTGHGVGAALIMATSRAFLRALLSQKNDLEEVFPRLNDLVAQDVRRGQFVTLFAAIVDTRNATLTYTAAGHPPPFLVRCGSGALEELESTGPPLGVMKNLEFPALRVDLQPGDLLVVATDGVWEIEGTRGEPFGRERFGQAVTELAGLEPEALVAELRRRLARFAGPMPSRDDVSIVAMRFDPQTVSAAPFPPRASVKQALLVVLGLVAAAMLLYRATLSQASFECEACMRYQGRSMCRTVAGINPAAARRGAISNACAILAQGVTATLECEGSPPVAIDCRER